MQLGGIFTHETLIGGVKDVSSGSGQVLEVYQNALVGGCLPHQIDGTDYDLPVPQLSERGKYGYIDANGQRYIRPIYTKASEPNSDGTATVVFNGERKTIRIANIGGNTICKEP